MALKFKTSGSSDDALAQLMQLAQLSQQRESRKQSGFASKQQALVSQLSLANNSEKLANLQPLISKFNQEVSLEGYDEYSLDSAYNEKKGAFNVADVAYKDAERYYNENTFQAEGITSTEDLYNKISSMNWEEMTQENADLYKIKNKIEIAEGYGYKHTLPSGVGGKSLGSAIDTRLGQIGARMHVWAENEGEFMVFDENGEMDGENLAMYQEYMYDIMSGDVASFKAKYGKDITLLQQKYKSQQSRYDSLNYLHQQAKAGKTSGEIQDLLNGYINQNLDENSSEDDKQMYNSLYSNIEDYIKMNGSNAKVDEEWFINQRANAMEKGGKYNKQHEVLTGDLWDTNPTWLGFDVAEETLRLSLEKSNRQQKQAQDKIEEAKKGTISSVKDSFSIGDKEHDLPYTTLVKDGEETKIPTLVDDKNKFTEEGGKYLFDKVYLRQNQEMDIGKTIANTADRQGVSQDKVWEEYRRQMDVYAKEEGVAKGEFKEVKRGREVVGYEFIPVKDRKPVEKKVSPPEDTPEYQAGLQMDWLKEEAGKKNITEAWTKNPKIYNEAIKSNVDTLLKTDNIDNIISFGNELKNLGIKLKGKKGAFPGLKDELNRLRKKIEDLIYSEDNAKFRNAYIKEVNKSFSWAGIYIAPEYSEVKVSK